MRLEPRLPIYCCWQARDIPPGWIGAHEIDLLKRDSDDDWLFVSDSVLWEGSDLREVLNEYLRWSRLGLVRPVIGFDLVVWDDCHGDFHDVVTARWVLRDITRGHPGQLQLPLG